MALCAACSKELSSASFLEKLASEILPPELELYDFGGGNIVAPKPAIPLASDSYLASHMAGLIEKNPNPRMLFFNIENGSWQRAGDVWELAGEIEKDLRRAVASFPEKAAVYSSTHSIPVV